MYITALHSHCIQVPDLAEGAEFFTEFGLEATEDGRLGSVRCAGSSREQLVLREGPEKRLKSVAFCVVPGSLPELRARLAEAGHPEVDGLSGRNGGLSVVDPDGLLVQLVEDEPAVTERTYPTTTFNFGDSRDRVDEPLWLSLGKPQPRRLGHVIKFTADLAASDRFYMDVLGLQLSDRMDGLLSFWNNGAGGDHHLFGAIRSSHPGLQHSSWEVADLDEIGMGAQNMAQNGHGVQWGLGRHTLGSNLFTYVRDPWGSWTEYFADMDVITPCWQGKSWEAPPAIWGPPVPPEFFANAEAVWDRTD